MLWHTDVKDSELTKTINLMVLKVYLTLYQCRVVDGDAAVHRNTTSLHSEV